MGSIEYNLFAGAFWAALMTLYRGFQTPNMMNNHEKVQKKFTVFGDYLTYLTT